MELRELLLYERVVCVFPINSLHLRLFRIVPVWIAGLLTVWAITAPAATIQWTNTLGGNWNVALNWSPNVTPASADIAVITNDGTYTINLNVTPTISGLILGGTSGKQTLATTPGGLTVNGSATVGPNGQFNYSSGTLTVTNGLSLQGAMLWSNGQLPATTALTVASNGTLTVAGSGSRQMFGAITNWGTITNANFFGSGVLHNLPSGLIILSQQGGFSGSLLVNDGTVRKVSPGGTATLAATTFINNGVMDAQAGTIRMQAVTMNNGSSYTGAGTNHIWGGTMNGSVTSENLLLYLGSLGGNGTLHGTMIWLDGSVAAGTSLTVASNATLFLPTSVSSKSLAGFITNAGTIKLIGAFAVTPSGLLHNLPDALIDAQPSGSIILSVGGLISNDGTIRKSAGTGTMSMRGSFVNNGVLDAQTGAISLDTSAGGTTVLGDGSSYIGAGTNLLKSYVTLAGDFTSENLVGDTSYLLGNGTLHGSMLFKGNSSIDPGGVLTIATDGTVTVVTVLYIAGSLTNAGTVAWDVSPGLVGSGTLHNLSSGLLDLRGNSAFVTSGSPRLINDGVFRKSAGTGTNTIPAGLPFINNGTILAQSGTLLFSGSLTNPAGTLAVGGGKIQSTTPLVIPGGRLTGSGTIEAPSITSAALVEPGAANAVLILSGSYTQQLAGTMHFDLGGSNPGVDQAQVIVTGNAHLNGTVGVRFSPGYTPDIGTNYTVLEAASHTGGFKCFDGFLLLGQNKRLSAAYSPTNLVLTPIAAIDPSGPSLDIAMDGRVLVCWPSEFTGYDLYSNTNLNGDDWILVPGASSRHFDSSLEPQKMFRLSKPQ